jgi:CRISPR type III-B/RAMP module-associated protein Cmr5
MKNLEQLRAQHALQFWANSQSSTKGQNDGDVVSKLPSLILNNGLLATLAFAKSKGGGHETLCECILKYLSEQMPGLRPEGYRPGAGKLDPYIEALTRADSILLQRATTEALAYLSYLKRFA